MKFIVPEFLRGQRPMGVYKISFDDQCFYIGSSIDLRQRFIGWKTRMRDGTNKNKKIRALVKSAAIIRFEVVEFVEKAEELRDRETYYIDIDWENPLLLNYCPSGNNNKGIRWSEEDLKNRTRPTFFAKPVAVFDGQDNLVNKFDFIADAAKYLNINRREIRDYLQGRRGTLKGHSLKLISKEGGYIEPTPFVSKRKPARPPKLKQPNTPSKEIIKYSLDGNEVSRYQSINLAAKAMGIDKSNFKKMVKKSKKGYYKGFIWKYA